MNNFEKGQEKPKQINLWGEEVSPDPLLRDKFIEPPFSVLDTKSGSWRKRKQHWLKTGIASEIGRGDNLLGMSDTMRRGGFGKAFNLGMNANAKNGWEKKDNLGSGTSIFDPALAELMYTWFCPAGGKILDPFAGGSVRGIVAQYLGFEYIGIDLREEQIEANRINAKAVLPEGKQPEWFAGDSDAILDTITNQFDFIFSCPPYMDLEVYSNDPNDISNMDDYDFSVKYESIIKKACSKLKHGAYACFVVSEIRDKKTGFYRDFLGITCRAFEAAGCRYYNDIILLNAIGTAALRVGGQFPNNKKVVKIHQNVMVFKK